MEEVINVNNENITVKNNKIYINGVETKATAIPLALDNG